MSVPFVTLVLLAPAVASLGGLAPGDVDRLPPPDLIDPELLHLLGSGAEELRIIVRFDDRSALAEHAVTLDRPVVPLLLSRAIAYSASAKEITALLSAPGVAYIEHDARVPVLLDTAVMASRAAALWSGFGGGPVLHPVTNETIDGRGVGVAVIDTGADGTNLNLAPALVSNRKVVDIQSPAHTFWTQLVGEETDPSHHLPDPFIPMDDTDLAGGHGTHVAGVVAARGVDGPRGAAPGSGLYVFGAGTGQHIVTSYAAASFEWIVANHDQVDPPIKVITNSYGYVGAHEPASIMARLTTAAVQEGLSVVFGAGNGDALSDGGNGSDNRLTSYAQHPLPGVVSVANYDDLQNGTRDGGLSPSSSRGLATDPTTWPDLSAPGTLIESTAAKTDPLAWALAPLYQDGGIIDGHGNTAGNAINQWRGAAEFRFGTTVSDDATLALVHWDLPLRPIVIYNAHEDRYIIQHSHEELLEDPGAVQETRFFTPSPLSVPPLYPMGDARQMLTPGDKILLTQENGSAQAPSFRVVAPTGAFQDIRVRFDCRSGCAAEIDLYESFGPIPADGTWTLTFGRTVWPEHADEVVPHHTQKSGTSMAAPHVAGAIAMMYQANPGLVPAQIESILKRTAYRYGNEVPYTVNGSFDKGHGLVDVQAAVLEALVTEPIPPEDEETDPWVPGEPIRTHRKEGDSLSEAWPLTAPPALDFPVPHNGTAILYELQWTALEGVVDLAVVEPDHCASGAVEALLCNAPWWVFGESQGAHRVPGNDSPAAEGQIRYLMGTEEVRGATCDEAVCTWQAFPIAEVAVQMHYDLRVTVVHEGELPPGYSAFDP